MFKPKFKFILDDINQILPYIDYSEKLKYIHRIIPLIGKPKIWNNLNLLKRDLNYYNHVYFKFNNKYYELICLKEELSLPLTKAEEAEILRKQNEIYEQLGGNY